jgi:hypothetical protein
MAPKMCHRVLIPRNNSHDLVWQTICADVLKDRGVNRGLSRQVLRPVTRVLVREGEETRREEGSCDHRRQ